MTATPTTVTTQHLRDLVDHLSATNREWLLTLTDSGVEIVPSNADTSIIITSASYVREYCDGDAALLTDLAADLTRDLS